MPFNNHLINEYNKELLTSHLIETNTKRDLRGVLSGGTPTPTISFLSSMGIDAL